MVSWVFRWRRIELERCIVMGIVEDRKIWGRVINFGVVSVVVIY